MGTLRELLVVRDRAVVPGGVPMPTPTRPAVYKAMAKVSLHHESYEEKEFARAHFREGSAATIWISWPTRQWSPTEQA